MEVNVDQQRLVLKSIFFVCVFNKEIYTWLEQHEGE